MKAYIMICILFFSVPSIFGMNKIFQKCAKEIGVTESEVDDAVMRARLIPDTVRMNAFAKCQMLQGGAIDSDGYVNEKFLLCETLEICAQFRGKKVDPRELWNKFLYTLDHGVE